MFCGIHDWIWESFESIRSSEALSLSEAVRSYPVLSQPSSKQLFTALVLTSKSPEITVSFGVFKDFTLMTTLDIGPKNGLPNIQVTRYKINLPILI